MTQLLKYRQKLQSFMNNFHPENFKGGQVRKLELLVLLSLLLAFVVYTLQAYDKVTSGLALHKTATDFAIYLRGLQNSARQRAAFMTIEGMPATASKPFAYQVRQGPSLVDEVLLPDGVSLSGHATVDPHGIPVKPGRFVFRRANRKLEVQINSEGNVSVL